MKQINKIKSVIKLLFLLLVMSSIYVFSLRLQKKNERNTNVNSTATSFIRKDSNSIAQGQRESAYAAKTSQSTNLTPLSASQGLHPVFEPRTDPRYARWRTPIEFYGIVIDENGNSVEKADIWFSWNNTAGTQERHEKAIAMDDFP